MNIHEYQAKAVLREFDVPVPRGIVAFSAAEAVTAAKELGGPVWWVTSVAPRIRVASRLTSWIDLTTLTPPALPRPPAWICALTTHTGPPS